MKILTKKNEFGQMYVAFLNPDPKDTSTDINVARSILTNGSSIIFSCESSVDEVLFINTSNKDCLDIDKLYKEIDKSLKKHKDVQIMKAFIVRVLSELMK